MNRPLLLIDVDGVLLDWCLGFRKYYESAGYRFSSDSPSTWALTGWIDGVNDSEEIRNLIIGFNQSKEFSNLKPTTGAVKFMETVSKEYSIIAVTSCSAKVARARRDNLEYVFGDVFTGLHCLELGESKYRTLATYKPSIWIEDNISGAEAGAGARHDVYLIDKPWNQGKVDEDIKRVGSLANVLGEIT